ncbi:MAG: Transglutaminase-like superfamily [Candidatus Parcubacteria bacterium]|jgi:hypothetical protein
MSFEHIGLPETQRETIETITLDEYKHLPPDVQEWLQMSEEVPEHMWDMLSDIDPSMKLIDVLKEIRSAVIEARGGHESNSPTSFEDSRFTSFEDIVQRNLDSCGVRARVFGTTLRKMGIPVRFVDGKRLEDEEAIDHAWLDIYSPKGKTWIECDPGESDFRHHEKNKRDRVFHDWDELKAVHDK